MSEASKGGMKTVAPATASIPIDIEARELATHKAHCFMVVWPENEFMGCKYGPDEDCPAKPIIKKNKKLEEAQRAHRELLNEIEPLQKERRTLDNRIKKKQKKLKQLGNTIYDLKHNGLTPEITDHAIVRYLERVKGWDIPELKVEVANHKNAKRVGNVVVTVNEEREADESQPISNR